jgi:hypothetical protein
MNTQQTSIEWELALMVVLMIGAIACLMIALA